jgi:D-alanyl-D-alanine carboxypeptidase
LPSLRSCCRSPPYRAVLQELMEVAVERGYPGVLVRVEDEAGTWTSTAGVANLKTGEPMRSDSHWRIASVTKMLVATTVLRLVGDGQLGLDDTVEDAYPGLLTGAKADQITIRHLLSMRSGLFQYLDDPSILGPHNPLGLGYEYYARGIGEVLRDSCQTTYDARALVALSDAKPLYFAPGSSFNYANVNYIVLGLIIEHLSGKTYQQAIHDQILEPLGMGETTFVESGPLPAPHPHGYTLWFSASDTSNPRFDVTDCKTSVFGAAGSAVADADDLATFTSALLDGDLLPDDLLDETLATDEIGPGFGYGLGLVRLGLPCGVDIVGHDGAVLGFLTQHFVSEDGSRTMTIMGNEYVEPPGAFDAILDLLVTEFCGDGS